MSDEERRDGELTAQRRALNRVLEERDHQIKRWTPEHDRRHTTQDWSTILTSYNGKVASTTSLYLDDKEAFKKRVTQLAAICLAALEAVDG
jgi:hypothetical protein